jgi:predicted amidohydrolase YtcJ
VADAAEVIYVGGDIVTMDGRQPTAEALAVGRGRISAIGDRDQILSLRNSRTRIVDLAGATLLPGFIDPHSHYINSLTIANQANLFAPPAGPGRDVPSIVATLKAFRDTRALAPGDMIVGYGYDDTLMPGGRTLCKEDLDVDFPDTPVIVGHVSMHGAVLNSAAMRKFGINADTETPPGGVIVRKPGTNEPDGLVMELAYLPVMSAMPKPSVEQEVSWSIAGQRMYAAAGITTAHEGLTHAADVDLMFRAAAGGATLIDIVAYPFILELDQVLAAHPPATFGRYHNRVKLGGVKVTLDGSPQGRTAFFTTPYRANGPDGQSNWHGELGFSQETVNGWFQQVYDLGLPLDVHANGDAAIDVALAAHEFASRGEPARERRTVMVHSQFVRPDQLKRYRAYNIIPSFFTEHAFYFGDAHVELRGKAQADFLSPMRAAIDVGLLPTNHTDFVVTPLDQMFLVWTAVNRLSRSGAVIGEEQRVSPLEALQAITINAARQYGESDAKGSLSVGKLADLVVLADNPLKVDQMKIKDIQVVETIKEGVTIYTGAA